MEPGFLHKVAQTDVGQVDLKRVFSEPSQHGVQPVPVPDEMEQSDHSDNEPERIDAAEISAEERRRVEVHDRIFHHERHSHEYYCRRPWQFSPFLYISPHVTPDDKQRDARSRDRGVRTDFVVQKVNEHRETVRYCKKNDKIQGAVMLTVEHFEDDREHDVEPEHQADEPQRVHAARRQGIERHVFQERDGICVVVIKIFDHPEDDADDEVGDEYPLESFFVEVPQAVVFCEGVIQAHPRQEDEDFYADASEYAEVTEYEFAFDREVSDVDDAVRDRVAEVGGEVEEHDAQNRYAEQFASVTADPAKVEFMVVFQNIPL